MMEKIAGLLLSSAGIKHIGEEKKTCLLLLVPQLPYLQVCINEPN
jgi:hypothetical protein